MGSISGLTMCKYCRFASATTVKVSKRTQEKTISPGAYSGFFDCTTSEMPYVEMMVPGLVAGNCECATAGSYNPKRWYGSIERYRFFTSTSFGCKRTASVSNGVFTT